MRELSFRKGKAVYDELNDDSALIISSDTVVVIDNKILGKPKSPEDAVRMLKLLSGRSHQVVRGVTLMYNGITLVDSEITEVKFSSLSDDVIERYVATNEPMDKAGSYAVQGLASMMIEGINGCYVNVVGFPVQRFSKMLKKIGIEPYSITKSL